MNRRLAMVIGVLVMGAIAFSLRHDGLLPDGWTPRPRAHVEEEDAGPPEEERATPATESPAAPPRRSVRPRFGRLLSPAPGAGSRASESANGRITGRVEDRLSGSPIPRAELTFQQGDGLYTARTGDDGRFVFEAPHEGVFTLALALAAGYFSYAPAFGHGDTVFVATAGQSVEAAVIRLEAEAVVRVIVHGPTGEVAPAQVRVLGAAPDSLAPSTDRYDAPNGTVRVCAREGSVLEALVEVGTPRLGYARLDAAAILTGVLHIHTRASPAGEGALQGQVLSLLGSEPIAGALVDIETETPEGDTRVAQAITDEEGQFRYDGAAPGPFTLWAHAPGFAGESRTHATRDAVVVLLLNEEASVEGRVVDEDGRPIVSFLVLAEAHVGVMERHLRGQRAVFDSRGEFHLGGLASGEYTISVAADGYAPQTREVRLARGDSVRAPDFRLSRGATVGGSVRSASGAPIAGARVQVESAIDGAGLPLSTEVQSNSEGAFQVSGLSPGQVFLTVAGAGHHALIVAATAGGPAVDVTLNPVADDEEPQLELAGIGASLRADGDRLVIDGLLDEGGAARAGLAVGERVTHIDGVAVDTLGFGGSIGRIRGPAGSQVLLRVRDDTGERDVLVTRVLVRAR